MPKLAVVRTPASPHTSLGAEDAHEQRAALRLAPVVSVQVRSYDLNPTRPVTEVGCIRTTNTFPSLVFFWGVGWGVVVLVSFVFWGDFFRLTDVAGKSKGLRHRNCSSSLKYFTLRGQFLSDSSFLGDFTSSFYP